jgi:predicted nucleotidyltransferase
MFGRVRACNASDNCQMRSSLSSLLANDGPVVSAILARLPNTMAIYAFGSQVHGTANVDSDLDLAVLVAGYAEALSLWDLAGDLADVVACHVDLVDLRAATTVMQYQVITTGERLWSVGLQAGLFECYVLSEKTDLDRARAPLLADILSTGKIYAR